MRKIVILLIMSILFFSLFPINVTSVWIIDDESDFDEGIYDNTYYDYIDGNVQLNTSQMNGNYTSKVFNAEKEVHWSNISWTEGEQPEGQEVIYINFTQTHPDNLALNPNNSESSDNFYSNFTEDNNPLYRIQGSHNGTNLGEIIDIEAFVEYYTVDITNDFCYCTFYRTGMGVEYGIVLRRMDAKPVEGIQWENRTSWSYGYPPWSYFSATNLTGKVVNYNKVGGSDNGVFYIDKLGFKVTYIPAILKLNLSIRSCDDGSCSGESWIDVNDVSPQILNISDNQYFQYKFEFTTENISYTPELYNVTVNYNCIPNKPTNPIPIDNATSIHIDTTLKVHVIDNDNDTMSVSFYWSNDTFIETVTDVQNNSDAESSSHNLNYSTEYSWYAIVSDSELENTSDTFSFTTISEPHPPNKPIGIYPLDRTTCIDINTTFRTKVIDIDNDSLNVSFYINDIFIEKISNISNNTIVESSNLLLEYSNIYTWYVIVEDEYFSVTSDIFIFATTCQPEPTIPNLPPEKPILILPDNNSINISKFTRLKTHVDDLDDDFLYVSFYWENNSEIQSLFSITNYTIQTSTLNLEYNITYSWYVIVTDFVDYNISNIYTFTTEIEVIEDDISPLITVEHDYTILLIGICLAIFIFVLEFFSDKLKIKRTKVFSTVELALLLMVIFIMIFLKFT